MSYYLTEEAENKLVQLFYSNRDEWFSKVLSLTTEIPIEFQLMDVTKNKVENEFLFWPQFRELFASLRLQLTSQVFRDMMDLEPTQKTPQQTTMFADTDFLKYSSVLRWINGKKKQLPNSKTVVLGKTSTILTEPLELDKINFSVKVESDTIEEEKEKEKENLGRTVYVQSKNGYWREGKIVNIIFHDDTVKPQLRELDEDKEQATGATKSKNSAHPVQWEIAFVKETNVATADIGVIPEGKVETDEVIRKVFESNDGRISMTLPPGSKFKLHNAYLGVSRVWVLSPTKHWRECTVTDFGNGSCNVHYISFDKKFDEKMNWKDERIRLERPRYGAGTELFKEGDNVSVFSLEYNCWLEADVLSVVNEQTVSVMCVGGAEKELIQINSKRLSLHHKNYNDPPPQIY